MNFQLTNVKKQVAFFDLFRKRSFFDLEFFLSEGPFFMAYNVYPAMCFSQQIVSKL